MAAPIADQIVDEIVTTLGGITIGNGYQQTVSVQKLGLAPITPTNNLLVVAPHPPVLQGTQITLLDEYIMAVEISAFSIVADSSADVRERLVTLASDIRRKLMADRHRNGKAANTLLTRPAGTSFQDGVGGDWQDRYSDSTSPAYVIVMPRVQFRTLRDNPYQR